MQGVHTALVTPFVDGRVDLDAYARLARRQLDGGVTGLVPCGTTGETPTLIHGEWEDCLRTAVSVAEGAPVTAGIGTNNTVSSVANAARAQELGVDAGLLVFPYYNKPNRRGHIAHIQAVAEVGLPLVVYHVPGRTGQRLSLELLAELTNLDGVIAVKEATGDVGFGSDLRERTDRDILSGDDFTFMPLVMCGGNGVISVVSNVAPKMTSKLCAAALAGDRATAERLHHRLMPLVHYLFADSNPVPCKAAMAAMGLCTSEVRLPLAPALSTPPAGLLDGLE
ncbi:MAG: 4-hydroxy-tetrahydrodipicolinate synthase [Proteobacteria bacterium]|nr:4-hydroxy-tetrahydrodipicolinate synthase [Pseudomonadota bacterium]MCP4917603.1 4-hydroxy-tetrahydrodipicolinate synthase [Pseudomonadota bacterium]